MCHILCCVVIHAQCLSADTPPSSPRSQMSQSSTQTLRQVLTSQPAVSVPVAAKLLTLSRNATYAAVRRGELPSAKIGDRILVPTSALRKLLLEQEGAEP